MDARYKLHGIIFEWNRRKAATNLHKHGISFELACEAFFDPFLHNLDEQIVDNEQRDTIIGMTPSWRLLYIVYELRDDIVRIISARSVTKVEREKYENQ
jgi:uncharacterized protein